MRYAGLLIVGVVIGALVGCASENRAESGVGTEPEEHAQLPKSTETDNSALTERKIIKEGTLSFETKDLQKTRLKIEKLVKKYNGYISKEESSTTEDRISEKLTIRIPSKHFESIIHSVSRGVSKFDVKSSQLFDVSEKYVDIEARLQVKKDLENRYRQILAQANSVKEILETEKQIGEIRSEIDAFEGKRKLLDNKITLSTLYVNFYRPLFEKPSLGKKFANAIIRGWELFLEIFIGITHIWPLLLLGSIVVLILRFVKWKKSA